MIAETGRMQLEDEGQRKRWSLSRLLGRSKAEQGPRIVTHAAGAAPPHTLLHPLGGPQRRYRGNRTSTTKYTLLTFLPKSLFEQYRWGGGVAAAHARNGRAP